MGAEYNDMRCDAQMKIRLKAVLCAAGYQSHYAWNITEISSTSITAFGGFPWGLYTPTEPFSITTGLTAPDGSAAPEVTCADDACMLSITASSAQYFMVKKEVRSAAAPAANQGQAETGCRE